jgi:hypothetical protein
MLLIWAIPLGVLAGYIQGGRLSYLGQINLRGVWLIVLALILQLLIFPLGPRTLVTTNTEYLHLFSYALLVLFAAANWREWGIVIMGAGMALNLLVIALNGGYMPVTAEALRLAGRPNAAAKLEQFGIYGNNIVQTASTRLAWLSDRFYTPAWLPLANVFSVGDVLLALGLIWFLQAKMRPAS